MESRNRFFHKLEHVLSARALQWIAKHLSDLSEEPRPETEGEMESFRRACEGHRLGWSPEWGAFEQKLGGVSLHNSETGARETFGVDANGYRARAGRVVIGTFHGGFYVLDGAGRVWVDDQVIPPFVFADHWKTLFERFAIDQEYPVCRFHWPGLFAVEIADKVAPALAGRLGATPVKELSDTCQSVHEAPGVGIWSSPEFAEMSVAGTVAVAEDASAVRRVLEALAASCPDIGASIGVGRVPGAVTNDETVTEIPPIPASSKGLRFERWSTPDVPGALLFTETGGVEQWCAVKDGVQIDRIEPSGLTRTRKIKAS